MLHILNIYVYLLNIDILKQVFRIRMLEYAYYYPIFTIQLMCLCLCVMAMFQHNVRFKSIRTLLGGQNQISV